MKRPSSNALRETTLPIALLAGDAAVTFGALSLSWWLRYVSPVGSIGLEVPDATYRAYLPLIGVGLALLMAAFVHLGLYDSRLLLRRYQSLNVILKGTAFWFAAYLGVSLVLDFTPPISRLFAILAFFCVIVLLYAWRSIAYAVIVRSPLLPRVQFRAIILGWNDAARALAAEIRRDPTHPFTLAGIVSVPADSVPETAAPPDRPVMLGDVGQLPEILRRERADILIAARLDLPREQLREAAEVCEREYVEWKAVAGAFDIFLNGLRLQTIGRVPVLGVEQLAIDRLFNRALKRAVDIACACIGLAVSAIPLLIASVLIRRESPGAPALFRQTRVGAGHRPFTLLKLRSMRPDAPSEDHARQSTSRDDPRLLRIGAFLRRWNIDELPQFWNVLRGEMSLVGPRPERPHHVEQLAEIIPHYLPRHLVKPGMTGWAQVNGLRGDSDIAARVQHDIYYIENWSVWLDMQIILLTFARWRHKSAY